MMNAMISKIQFEFLSGSAPTSGLHTQFGGQPYWKETPHWPLSSETGEQMLFLGQILLEEQIFPGSNEMMAYIFIDEVEVLYNEAIVIVLQPGILDPGNAHVTYNYIAEAQGPSLYELDEHRQAIPQTQGYDLLTVYAQEPRIDPSERYQPGHRLDYEEGYQFLHPDLAGNKIGGQALYVESLYPPPAYFTSDQWTLLLQLAPKSGYWHGLQPNFYPFQMELGEFGLLSIFIKKDYSRAKAYVQQP